MEITKEEAELILGMIVKIEDEFGLYYPDDPLILLREKLYINFPEFTI
jgi:hypothetical protein